MNDLGANVATILDDNQMSYSTIEDYVQLSRIENFLKPRADATFDLSKILSRDIKTDPEFTSGGLVPWGKGLKMNWKPVPKEDQKCHINWRQSINDDGSSLGRLDSFPKNENFGTGIVGANGGGTHGAGGSSKMKANKDSMDKGQEGCELWINEGKKAANNPDPMFSEYCMKENKIWPKILEGCKGTGIDTLLIACLMAMDNKKEPADTIAEYKNLKEKVGNNPATIAAAMSCGIEAVLGKGDNPSNIKTYADAEKAILPLEMYCTLTEGNSDTGSSKVASDKKKTYPKLDKSNIDNWLWTDFALALFENAKKLGKDSNMTFFCKVVYLYFAIAPKIRQSSFDGDEYGFPFTDEECDECDGIQYSGLFGEDRGNHIHRGIDLATGDGHTPPIHAIKAGKVTAAGDGWGSDCAAINIQHDDGTYARYLHCSHISVSTGAYVNKGDVIGNVGGMGSGGPNSYPMHLHLEVGQGESESAVSTIDPITLFNCNGIAHNQMFRSGGIS